MITRGKSLLKCANTFSFTNLVSNPQFKTLDSPYPYPEDYTGTSIVAYNQTDGYKVNEDGNLQMKATAQNGKISQSGVSLVNGHKYFYQCKAYSSSSLFYIWLSGLGAVGHSGGGWEVMAGLFTWSASTGNWAIELVDQRTSGWTLKEIDGDYGIVLVDLTEEDDDETNITTLKNKYKVEYG